MIPDLLELGADGLYLLLVAAWRALPLLLIVSLLDLGLRRRLAPRYHAFLWSLVVIRLVLPVSLPSPWSLHGPLDQLVGSLLEVPASQTKPLPAMIPSPSALHISDVPVAPRAAPAWQPPARQGVAWHQILLATLVGLWAVVAAGLLLRSLVAHVRFGWRLRRCRELCDGDLIDTVLRECDRLRVSRRPKLKEVAELSAPAVFGLLRSTICLPRGTLQVLSADELRWVLRHELAHVRRRDAWLISLASVMRSLHWFNPIAWLVAARLRTHLEAAADDLALGRCLPTDAVAYGRLLLKFAERSGSLPASPAIGLLQFVSTSPLRGRIERLTGDRAPGPRWVRWSVASMIAALAAVGLTDASERSVPAEPMIHLPAVDLAVRSPDDADQGATSVARYDVAAVLERIRQADPAGDAERLLLALLRTPIVGKTASDALQLEGSELVAEMTQKGHQELARVLQAWQTTGPRQIVIELRVFQADVSHAASIDWAAEKQHDLQRSGSGPLIATTIADDQLRRLIESIQEDPRGNLLQAPKMTLFNGQTASCAALVQRPFVTGVHPRADRTLEPVVEVLDEGLKVLLRPVATEDGAVALTLQLQMSQIGNVAFANLPYRDPLPPHPHVTVQVPSVSTTSVQADVQLSAGETLLIAAPQVFDTTSPAQSSVTLFYAFTPRILDDLQ